MSGYTDRYRTPSPNFPKPSPTTLGRLLASWEQLRALNTDGYRTSKAVPTSTWLTKIHWADGRVCGRSVGRGTTCSPFVTQATAMAYSALDSEPYCPVLADGTALPILFSHAANGVLSPQNRQHQELMDRYGMTMADNEWPRPVIFFNLGTAVELKDLRRGDAVHIDWMNGGGHAVFCWDVHLNDRGEVDAFLYVSSNGSMANGGAGGGVSVGGTANGAGGFIGKRAGATPSDLSEHFAQKSPLFVDDERYVVEGAWVTWDDAVAGTLLTGLRARPKSLVKKAKRVAAARFHGIDVSQIPLYAMGQDQPAAWTSAPAKTGEQPIEITTPPRDVAEDTRALQRRLKLLSLIGWIGVDPGKVDGKPGRKTAAAVVAFQRAYGCQPDGKAGPRTLAKLDAVFRSAGDAPQAKQYLSPGQPGGLAFAADDWEDSAQLYFRHGTVRAGGTVDLVLTGDNLPQQALKVLLLAADSKHPLAGAADYSIAPLGDRAVITLTLPERAAGHRIIARIADADLETAAALLVG